MEKSNHIESSSSSSSSSSSLIVMIPSPGMGHLIPLVELAKLLVHHNQTFTVTFLIPTILPPTQPQLNLLQTLPPSITHSFLPPVDFHDLPHDTKTETKITLAVSRSLSHIHNAFQSLVINNSNVVGLVVDIFGTDAFDVAKHFDIPCYLFWSSMAIGLVLLLHLPKLDQTVSCEFKEMDTPVTLPGNVAISRDEFPEPLQDRKSEAYKWFLQYHKRVDSAQGVLINTFLELEPEATRTLENDMKLRVYPIGPIIQTGASSSRHECLEWLDQQPKGSVLFVSFGSGGTLSYDQLNALAFGLEISEVKFLWVVKCPNDKTSNATFFNLQSQEDPLGFLPKGFKERSRGLLVASWAPQSDVLGHDAIGGFLSHCGWNSILESVVNGVPIIAWPLYAEQKMNAKVLCEGLKVALRPKASENGIGIIGCEEICRVVKELMEGEEGFRVRERMRVLKEGANMAMSEEGSSREALSKLVTKLKK